MGMRLSPDQLADIASKVEGLDGLGVEVKEIEVHDHKVFLAKNTGTHMVVGISFKQEKGGATR